jgi:hypothetical protein
MQLSADGSRLLFGTGVLINTATGEALQLAARGGFLATDPPSLTPLVNEGMSAATMSSGATRFLYLSSDPNNVLQLATMDLNPGSLGPSPSVTDPQLDPTFVLTQGRSRSTLSARVSATGTNLRVNNSVLFKGLTNPKIFNGLTDGNVDWLVLFDDGTTGDITAGDGIFTNNHLGANSDAVLGSRLVRVKAEVRGSDGKRHATAIDFEPLTVTDQVPSIDVSQTSLDFGSVLVGQSKDLTLTIRNIGTGPLTINALTSNNSQFGVPAPAAPFTIPPGGQQTVTVRFTPSTVGPQGGLLTISSSDPARPSIDVFLSGVGVVPSFSVNDHRMSGGPIPGGCGLPTAKNSFAPTDPMAYQWTFVSGLQSGDVIRWEWVQPNGSIFKQFQAPVFNNGNVCVWDAIDIAGQPAASLLGNWQVRVFYNGALIVTENFTISGGTQTQLLDHRMTGGPIPGACDPPTAKSTFAPTDPIAYQWTFVSGLQSGDVVRWEWVQPNGSIYRQFQGPVFNNGNVCFWDGIDIAGQPAASLPGIWQVRVFFKGTLIVTENFTISGGTQPPLLAHRMTGGPIPGGCDLPIAKNSFAPTDPMAYQWTFVSGLQSGDVVRWEWVQPNGSIFKQLQAPVFNNGNVCVWDAIDIAGQPAASLPGIWQVRVFFKDALIVTENFTISACSVPVLTRLGLQAGRIVLEWQGPGRLQAASEVTGPWTDVPGAVSPFRQLPAGAMQFFRIAP